MTTSNLMCPLVRYASSISTIVLSVFVLACDARAEVFDCIMEPAQRVKVGSAVTGVLKSVLVNRGDTVQAGEDIAQLDSTIEEANLAVVKAQALSMEGVEAQRTRVALAAAKLERANPLADKNIVTRDKLEGYQADYDISKRDLNSELIKHQVAELDLERAKAALALRTIKSPLTGIVIEKHLSAGEFVNQEAFILTLVQLDPLYVEAYIPVSFYGRIKSGIQGTVYPAEPIGGSYPATITVTDRVFDAASGTYGVRLELKNPDNALPGGERCRVDFDVSPAPNKTPEAALQSTSPDATKASGKTSPP